MSKQSSTELFQLIKSLSANEKGYFKKYVSKHTIGEKNKSVILFDAIEKQAVYDEKEILKNEKEIGAQQLPDIKNHLYKILLRALDSFHFQDNEDVKAKNIINAARILYDKGLYGQSEKILKKNIQQLKQHENFLGVLDCLKYLKKIALSKLDFQNIEELADEEKETLEKLENIRRYEKLNARLYIITMTKGGNIRNEEHLKRLKAIINDPLLKDENNALTVHSKSYFLSIHGIYHMLSRNLEKNYEYTLKRVKLIESTPFIIANETQLYINAINNHIHACGPMRKPAEANLWAEKLKAIKTNSLHLKARIFIRYYSYVLMQNFYAGNLKAVIKMLPDIEKGFDEYNNLIREDEKIMTYFVISLALFVEKKYSQSLFWLNKILNSSATEIREDYQVAARLFNLIIHFELKNTDLLEYIILSTYRFLYKRNNIYKIEKLILDFIRYKVSKIHTHKQQVEAFKELRDACLPLMKEPFERVIIDYLQFIPWLESKIKNKSLAELIKENYKTEYA